MILNAFPYNNGHVMIAPYEHTGALEDLADETVLELMQLTQRSIRALAATSTGPRASTSGVNQGKVAGAGVEDHIHQHVVPRWGADTNFMPVVGSTRVLPQSLADSYRALRERF